jgi:DNA-binding NtrC family response regulator
MGTSVVVLEGDPKTAQSLAGGLRPHFHSVYLTRSRDEMLNHVTQNRPEVVIFGIESSRLSDVASLHNEFPALPIVCTHRVPDEEMWMAALQAGASDVCVASDVENVLISVLRSVTLARRATA